jgi:4-hydroxybenzoyl-CoA reductase subunit beta
MRLPPFSYLEPETLEEALDLLSTYGAKARIVAGGTDVVPLLKKKLLAPQFIISLKDIKALRGVQKKRRVFEAGCNTTLREVAANELVKSSLAGLHEATVSVAAPPIKNVASLVGNLMQNTRCLYYNQSELVRGGLEPCYKRGGALCHAVPGSQRCFSVYQGDVAVALIALSGEAEVVSKKARRFVPVADLFSGKGRNPFTLKPDQMIACIRVPVGPGRVSSSYEKLRLRGAIDYPLVSCAVRITTGNNGRIKDARIVLGACGPAPKLLDESARVLLGTVGDQEAVEQAAELAVRNVELVNNTGVPADYRRRMAPIVIRRAIMRALQSTGKDG